MGEHSFSSCSVGKNLWEDSLAGSILYHTAHFSKTQSEACLSSGRGMTTDVFLQLMFSNLVHIPAIFTEGKTIVCRLWASHC